MNDDLEKWYELSEVKQFLERARTEMFPKLKDSGLSLTILNSKPDPKLCLEIGASIMFDKPIIVLAVGGRAVPHTLRKVAAEVVEISGTDDPEARDKIKRAIERVLGRQS